jgi:bifunctional UDP-N-acetylglucosamine pyrophosphorylase / glucosamine-1-phosphate N-acetyltransferase
VAKRPLAVVILAAGEGTRMKSQKHKVLHEAAGRPLLEHILRAIEPLQPERIVVVVGFSGDSVRERFKDTPVTFVIQDFNTGYGTGHALMQTEAALKTFKGDVMVLNGDGPLLKSETLEALVAKQQSGTGMTLITCKFSDPTGMGRIIRDENGKLSKIIEEKEATAEQKALHEINPGVYIFDETVFSKTKTLNNDNASGEYYITDLPGIYLSAGQPVQTLLIPDETEVLGVNNRKQLAVIDGILQDRIRDKWLTEGVTMISPAQTFIDDTVELGRDVVLEPGVILKGQTVVGAGARVGAYAHLSDCKVAPGADVPPHTVAKNQSLENEK